MPATLPAQSVFQETFTGTSASGWVFGGLGSSTDPYLTAGVVSGDTDGNGWLRLTNNTSNQATYALLDTEIFSVGAQIQVEMEYAFYNKGASTMGGGDGMTFFLVDGSVDVSTFQPGAYGGSLGYAPLDANENNVWDAADKTGMAGGYLGFGFDNWGNYGDSTEGRDGNFANPVMGHQNTISVRGPDDGDGNNSTGWDLIASSSALQTLTGGGQMDFPDSTTRPSQTGASYRSFRLTLDANNLLVVEMKFGVNGDWIVAFTADLSSFDRPETFKIGFTASTGGAYEIHEVRNVSVVSTPNATIGGSFEWDDGKASTDDDWGLRDPVASGGQSNANWFSLSSTNNNKTPFIDSDIFFGSRPANTSAGVAARPSPYASIQNVNLNENVRVKSLNFNSKYDYVLGSTTGKTIELGNNSSADGTPSINVTDSIANPRFHTINNNLIVNENLKVANESHSTLTLNGTMALGSNTLSTVGAGQTNFNGVITGSGPIVANGAAPNGRDSTGIVTIAGNNAATYTGAITVNGGQLVALHNGALGDTGSGKGTTVNAGGTLTFRGGITTSENLTLRGEGTNLSEIWTAGAIYNDGGVNNLNGAITLAGDTTLRSRDGNLIIGGAIGETGGARALIKTGDGVVTLNADNTYTGETRILGGALRVGDANRINGSDVILNGGVLELTGDLDTAAGTADFTRGVGTTSGDDVRWAGDGGFSASGGNRTVNLGAVTWATGGFVGADKALLLSSTHSDSTITVSNAIALAGATREIRVANGSAAVDGAISGVLSGNTSSGINKTGAGTLSLTGANTYAGNTVISDGALRVTSGSLPGGFDTSNTANNFRAVQLAGGVLELNSATAANFTRSLGSLTTEEAIRWADNTAGGFAASGADITVRLNNSTTSIAWGANNFIDSGQALILGSRSADATLIWDKALDLNGTTQTIQVVNGVSSFTGAEARVSQAITNGALTITGDGRLDLTANNTYTGATTINGAEVRLRDSGQLTGDNSAITISGGGALVLDNNGTAGNYSRIHDSSDFTLNAGRLELIGRASDTTARVETADNLTLSTGASVVRVTRGASGGNTRLDLDNLTRGGTSAATVDFQSGSDAFVADATSAGPGLIFTGGAAVDDGILAFATVNGADFATKNGNYIQAYSGYGTNINVTTNAATTNVALTGTTNNLTVASQAINSLKLGSGANLSLGTNTLTINSGGLLTTGTVASTISGGTLTSGSAEMVIHSYNTAGTTISSTLTGTGATTISGDGKLTLSGTTANTRSGTTTLNTGILELNKSAGVTAIAGNLVIGDTSGTDTVKILANEQIADTATVTLRGGTLLNNNNQAVLDIGDSLETFATLDVTGNSVIDFSGGSPSAPSFLVISSLLIDNSSQLTVRNWIDAADYFLIAKAGLTSGAQADITNRIIFDGYGTATWEDYSSDYFMITPHASPVPEPATFGLLSLGGLGSFALLRRRRRARG